MTDIDKEINELVNNHSKLDLAQMVVERDSSIETLNKLIEDMKCCENCEHNVAIPYCCHDCVNWSNWKLRNLD